MSTIADSETLANRTGNRGAPVAAILLPFLLSMFSPMSIAPVAEAQEAETGASPDDIWSAEYVNQIHPWGGDEKAQFSEYHDYFSLKNRMQFVADRNPDILPFDEGLLGGIYARENQMTLDD